MAVTIKNLTKDAFASYGDIIELLNTEEPFQVILQEQDVPGWQIAISKVTQKVVSKFGLHPNTRESFEPLAGISLIVVAEEAKPQEWEVFLLDQPVCLHKNIWHATFALSETAYLKITENTQVKSKEYVLERPIGLAMIDI